MFYSQYNEDSIIYEKYFKNYEMEGQKYYFEMGAMNGLTYSNTKFYEDTLGWKGILVEPNPFQFSELILNRPNNYLINAICSDQKSPLDFRLCKTIPAVSSIKTTQPLDFDYMYYNHSQMIDVKYIPISLDTILENSGLTKIDFCIIDVEGHEVHVLNSFSFKFPVVLWLIEFLGDKEKDDEVTRIMESNNCKFIEMCARNAIFINKDYLKNFNLE